MPDYDPSRDAPPVGVEAFDSLAMRRRLPAIVRESLRGLLNERGLMWRVRGTADSALCTPEDFDRGLTMFLERVPEAVGMVADHRARQIAFEREANVINAQQRRTMEAMQRDPFPKDKK